LEYKSHLVAAKVTKSTPSILDGEDSLSVLSCSSASSASSSTQGEKTSRVNDNEKQDEKTSHDANDGEKLSQCTILPKFDPKDVWFYYSDEAPELTTCALALLSLPSSEASVERSFSQQAIVHRKHRNRLNSQQVEAEVILKFNRDRVGAELPKEDYSLVSVIDIDCMDGDEDIVPLFEVEEDDIHVQIEEEEEGLSDTSAGNPPLPPSKSAKRKPPKQSNSIPESDDTSNARSKYADGQEMTQATIKRRKVGERTEVIIPHEDYANIHLFIKSYVEKHQLVNTI
jgi:hAT family C-terminal dimerisation region